MSALATNAGGGGAHTGNPVGLPVRGSTRARWVRSRPARVCWLLAAVVAVSVADLDLTLLYSRTTGMMENNPIARQIMSSGSVGMLVAWKVFTVGLAAGILFLARRHRTAELGAWLCLAIMLWLAFRWESFNDEVMALNVPGVHEAAQADPRWIVLAQE